MHRSDGIIRLNQNARWDILSYIDLCGFCADIAPGICSVLFLNSDRSRHYSDTPHTLVSRCSGSAFRPASHDLMHRMMAERRERELSRDTL